MRSVLRTAAPSKKGCNAPAKFEATYPTACFAAQGEELEPAREKAKQFGVKEIFIDDLREEFVKDYVFPMFR